MNVKRHWLRPALIAGLAMMLVLAACSSNPNSSSGGDGDELSGEIVASGSSTVEPITSIALEDFTAENSGVTYTVDGPGTGDGFAIFCEGETDISDASRAINEEEVAACEANSISYIELQIGIDGLSVITSHDNADVTCLSFGDLYALLGPESQGFDNWTDANDLAAELGGDFGEIQAPYPDAELVISAPGEESGTFDSFVELVIADIAEAREQDETTRPDYPSSPDDLVIIENIAGSPSSLGWVGYAFAVENADTVKLLEVDGGEGCVAPTPETIASGEYPISRPLFIYVNAEEAEARPELAAFVDFFLSDEGIDSVTEADYVALDEETIAATREAWEAR